MTPIWLIVNAFLRTPSFIALQQAFSTAASKMGIPLTVKDNASFLHDGSFRSAPESALFFDKDIRLSQRMEAHGIRLYNNSRTIAVCDDKTATYLSLEQAGIPQPQTILCPATYPGVGYGDMAFLDDVSTVLGFPLVVKEGYGSFGKQVYLVHSMKELRETLLFVGAKPMLFQTYVRESAGQDLRVYVVGNQAIAAIRRVNEGGDFRANLENGGVAHLHRLLDEERALAVHACQAVGADFAGVDLLFAKDGPLVCEINSNAHFSGLSRTTGINPAEHILRLIREGHT